MADSVPTRSPTIPAPTLPPNTVLTPPPCISNESEIAHINGMISPTQTFYTCLSNIGDPYSIPTFYNGSINGYMEIQNSIQLNNLHVVSSFFNRIAAVVSVFDFIICTTSDHSLVLFLVSSRLMPLQELRPWTSIYG
jgi:hypothetical protein